jgi:hypothetical protein
MDQTRFKLVFEKLAEHSVNQTGDADPLVEVVEAMRTELDEIAELRRLVVEITEPQPVSYTTT